jgi:hypothetical protein
MFASARQQSFYTCQYRPNTHGSYSLEPTDSKAPKEVKTKTEKRELIASSPQKYKNVATWKF